MLHFTFAQHEPLIPLEEELHNAEAYLNIVKARFGSRLTTEITLPEDTDVRDDFVPAFMLQPLAENAITHGLFQKPEDCRLAIRVNLDKDGNHLVIRVIDNGVGMSPETLQKLKNMESKGIGTANVIKRIDRIYQGQGGITFQSREGEGTTVTITLPIRQEA